MKKTLTSIGLAAVIAAGAMFAPAAANAASTVDLARADCRSERLDDPGEFRREHGTGKGAIARCATSEIRKARRECKAERRFETAEFRREYGGTGKQALRRCVRDEVR